MTDEMKKMFEELQKLVDELDRSKMQEMLNKMKMSNEELLQNLDRNLELFKQLEMEKMITEAVAKVTATR
jgi:BioD-like phosphotransacetylase family protein